MTTFLADYYEVKYVDIERRQAEGFVQKARNTLHHAIRVWWGRVNRLLYLMWCSGNGFSLGIPALCPLAYKKPPCLLLQDTQSSLFLRLT